MASCPQDWVQSANTCPMCRDTVVSSEDRSHCWMLKSPLTRRGTLWRTLAGPVRLSSWWREGPDRSILKKIGRCKQVSRKSFCNMIYPQNTCALLHPFTQYVVCVNPEAIVSKCEAPRKNPSRMFVIQFQFYTMSLSPYHGCCRYCESMSVSWVHVCTMSPCLYHESLSIPWVHVYTMSPFK